MEYLNKEYAYVNEKEFNGLTYTAYRSIDNPKKCLIVVDDKVIETDNLKEDWNKLNGS